jgi:RNA polymerase sigma factor (sigma-70 family)
MAMDINPVIFAAAQAGDPKALDELLALAHPDIRRYARRQCHASSALEDVVQEALIVLYRRVGTVRSPAALAAWLIKVVTRLCMLPVLGLMKGVEQLRSIDNSTRFAQVPTDEIRLDLVRAIESLPPAQREVILLRDLQEMTIGEIANALQITRGAAKSRLHRARGMLREFLSEEVL